METRCVIVLDFLGRVCFLRATAVRREKGSRRKKSETYTHVFLLAFVGEVWGVVNCG